MGNMAEAGFYGIMIALVVYAIFGSIAALILWGCAKGIGKIENANFGNAWLVVLFATLCNVVLTFLMGAMGADALWLALKLGLIGSMVVQAILVAIFYVVGGKLIWGCEWDQSAKAYSVLFALHIVLIIAAASWLSSIMSGGF